MKITFLGTTTLIFDDGVSQIQFDAHVTRPSLKKVMFGKLDSDEILVQRVIKEKSINRLHAIFISHSHYDHVLDVVAFAKETAAHVYGSESTLNVARGGNLEKESLHCFTDGDIFQIDNYSIQVLKSIHSTAHFYNNDLGMTIDEPLIFPAHKKEFKEGGSYDFLIKNNNCTYLIRPSFNYLPHQLDDIHADVMFLGIGGLSKASEEKKKAFFSETIDKVQPKTVIPIHWDNFFSPLYGSLKGQPNFVDNWKKSYDILNGYCASHHISCPILFPLRKIEIN